MPLLFVLFIVMPIAELYVLIQVGTKIGVLNTVLLVFVTAIVGVALLRQQGVAMLFRANQRLQQGELPLEELLSGMMLAFGGALLLTPGFITDAIGFSCLLPWTRAWLVAHLVAKGHVTERGFRFSSGAAAYQRPDFSDRHKAEIHTEKRSTTVIEGEFRREDDWTQKKIENY